METSLTESFASKLFHSYKKSVVLLRQLPEYVILLSVYARISHRLL